jgi:DNA topoisomerase VI subunit B
MPEKFKEKPRGALEVLGKDFEKICDKWKIEEELREKLKELIRKWDSLMSIKDEYKRAAEKMRVASEIIEKIDLKDREKFENCLMELMIVFVDKVRKRFYH